VADKREKRHFHKKGTGKTLCGHGVQDVLSFDDIKAVTCGQCLRFHKKPEETFGCIRCGDPFNATGTTIVCSECRGALCGDCVGVGDETSEPVEFPKTQCNRCDKAMEVKPAVIKNLKFVSLSLDSGPCNFCGSSDWEKPFMKKGGEVCHHPTKFKIRDSH